MPRDNRRRIVSRRAGRLSTAEEGVHTLMRMANELGVYEEENSRIVIPPRLKLAYWGVDHPNAKH